MPRLRSLPRLRAFVHGGGRARWETLTHLVRGVLFAAGALALSSYRAGGAWFWAIGALFVLDFANNLADGR